MARLASILALAALTGCAARSPVVQPVSRGWETVRALPAGTEVHVEMGGQLHKGRIESVSPDALVLRAGKVSQPIASRDIDRVYERVLAGKRKPIVNILLGVAGWTAIAGVVVAVRDSDDGKARALGTAAVLGAVSGANYPTSVYRERVVYIRW